MPTPDDPSEKLRNPETALGGADNVEKTTYGAPSGTEPGGQQRKGEPTAQVGSGKGPNLLAWIVGAVVVLFALVYAAGLFR